MKVSKMILSLVFSGMLVSSGMAVDFSGDASEWSLKGWIPKLDRSIENWLHSPDREVASGTLSNYTVTEDKMSDGRVMVNVKYPESLPYNSICYNRGPKIEAKFNEVLVLGEDNFISFKAISLFERQSNNTFKMLWSLDSHGKTTEPSLMKKLKELVWDSNNPLDHYLIQVVLEKKGTVHFSHFMTIDPRRGYSNSDTTECYRDDLLIKCFSVPYLGQKPHHLYFTAYYGPWESVTVNAESNEVLSLGDNRLRMLKRLPWSGESYGSMHSPDSCGFRYEKFDFTKRTDVLAMELSEESCRYAVVNGEKTPYLRGPLNGNVCIIDAQSSNPEFIIKRLKNSRRVTMSLPEIPDKIWPFHNITDPLDLPVPFAEWGDMACNFRMDLGDSLGIHLSDHPDSKAVQSLSFKNCTLRDVLKAHTQPVLDKGYSLELDETEGFLKFIPPFSLRFKQWLMRKI